MWISAYSPPSSRASVSLSNLFQCLCFIHSPMPKTSKIISLFSHLSTVSRLLPQWYRWKYSFIKHWISKSSEMCSVLALFDLSGIWCYTILFFLKLPFYLYHSQLIDSLARYIFLRLKSYFLNFENIMPLLLKSLLLVWFLLLCIPVAFIILSLFLSPVFS